MTGFSGRMGVFVFVLGFCGAALLSLGGRGYIPEVPALRSIPKPPAILRQKTNPPEAEGPAAAWSPVVAQVREKQKENPDVVGWLTIPDTALDDVVLQRPGDNDYYLRRNFERRYAHNGVFYADKNSHVGATAVDMGKNTVIYGHSMSDSKNDVRFGPMRYYLEEDFARTHPYLYFSTYGEELLWEVVAVFYTDISLPYNSNTLSEAEFAAMFAQASAKSLHRYAYQYRKEDKFLTLSTCVYSLPQVGAIAYPNDYRLGIMARLVTAQEQRKATAQWA